MASLVTDRRREQVTVEQREASTITALTEPITHQEHLQTDELTHSHVVAGPRAPSTHHAYSHYCVPSVCVMQCRSW